MQNTIVFWLTGFSIDYTELVEYNSIQYQKGGISIWQCERAMT